MRCLLLVPLGLLLTAAIAWVGCKVLGLELSQRDMLIAGGICLMSGELALVPLLLARGAAHAAVAQAALLATAIHLLLAIMMAGALCLARVGLGPGFLYWVMAFYWVTLIVLVACCVRAMRSAPADSTAPPTTKQ